MFEQAVVKIDFGARVLASGCNIAIYDFD